MEQGVKSTHPLSSAPENFEGTNLHGRQSNEISKTGMFPILFRTVCRSEGIWFKYILYKVGNNLSKQTCHFVYPNVSSLNMLSII